MDKKEALEIVQENGRKLENLPDHFKKDKEIVLEAVKQNGLALTHADDSLRKDPDILAVVNKNKRMWKIFYPNNIKKLQN